MAEPTKDVYRLWAHQIAADPGKYPKTSIEACIGAYRAWGLELPEPLIDRAVQLKLIEDAE